MDVYVESNFVLELVFLQEQHESCNRIIELVETGKANLIVPAYSIVEPHETMVRHAKKRMEVSAILDAEIKQLSRSKPYYEETDALQRATGLLVRSLDEQKERFHNTVNKLLAVSPIIPLDAQTFVNASKYQELHALTFQDSIVYASVLGHLSTSKSTAKCFLNRNSKDFDDPDIEETLNSYGCKMLFSFDQGYRYISSKTRD
jgi:predicted nucleic acid-binding protein